MTDIEYVIYCRKSTDESSGQQTQSIPDQIKKCVDYARNNGLSIKLKPEDFEFETEQDIFKEDSESDITNRQTFRDTRNLYIIKEQKSAKVPWLRPKWKRVISLIKQWKIKWLLSYSPDRQARNMFEWWELINCVDEGLIDLKYTNFHFENTASGKMMLGIWFVFSKQYSDKLSEDITRGKNSSVAKGKSQGKYKYWYYRDPEDWYYKCHPKYFPLMKEAFQMKLYMKASDEYIANWLNAQWFLREGRIKEGKTIKKEINAKMLYQVWIDEFYYGFHLYGQSIIDMREVNDFYQPMISEDEHLVLREKYDNKMKKTLVRAWTHRYDEIWPITKWMIKSSDEYALTPYIACIHRFEKRLTELNKTNPNITLKDIIKPNQVRFKVSNKSSKNYQLEVTFNVIEKEIIKKLDRIKIDPKAYKEYIEFINIQLDTINQENKEKYGRLLLRLNRVKTTKKDFVKRNMGAFKNKEEEEIYNEEMEKYDKSVEFIQNEMNHLNTSERNSILEFQIFIEILQKASKYYKKADYVQKRKICDILFLNIIVNKQKRLTLVVKPWLESLFSSKIPLIGDDGIRTHV